MRGLAAGAVVVALVVIREVLRFANEARQSVPKQPRPHVPDPDLPPTHTEHRRN
ncbi:hypothetical protein [Tenggerimyces flavus]|uniref:Uncharacterized protein n=1 Tax=Tenggerimyces flavus TaxID=1708749 RepID=A0ABV7YEH4_9ACTN|nr:hypothetical protein [Tenggerimyces flavus]MBM7788891.1 hypothetical protein [Tenggerimyces flavus]